MLITIMSNHYKYLKDESGKQLDNKMKKVKCPVLTIHGKEDRQLV